MFQSGTNYPRLKTNLRLAINRLKLLEKKKSELAQKARKEIADYISEGKYERAKIRVEHIIREDYLVEAMELIEMYCDLLLSRFGLLQEMKELDPSLCEPISSLLWVAPRLGSEVAELKMISDQLTAKYGKKYTEACRIGAMDSISEKLRHKLSSQAPPKILIEKYLIEIAKIYNISYDPDPQVMREYEQTKGMDALLFDSSGSGANNLDGPRPPGFVDFPQPPLIPDFQPFNYPPQNPMPPSQKEDVVNPVAPPFSYNIPPSMMDNLSPYDATKTINTYVLPPDIPVAGNNSDTNKQTNEQPKPLPRSKMSPDITLPDLPSVPDDALPKNHDNPPSDGEDDFTDIARRFEELKKRK
ncbi:increased sodium tolerance 1-like protein [Rhodnius prolixus]|uniref:IST1 homolog n=2 Tax=Rhodnius TaxID=13248 RepID=R4G8R3_RHOPR